MSTERKRPIQIGAIVVLEGPIGGPAMRVVAFSYMDQGLCVGGDREARIPPARRGRPREARLGGGVHACGPAGLA